MSTETAKPASAPKRAKPVDDEDDVGGKAAPSARAGMLPTGLSRAIVIGALFLSCATVAGTLLPHRYALVPAPRSDNALVYRIDALTGQVSLCSSTQCQPVAEKN